MGYSVKDRTNAAADEKMIFTPYTMDFQQQSKNISCSIAVQIFARDDGGSKQTLQKKPLLWFAN
jgi:hypothetical protein